VTAVVAYGRRVLPHGWRDLGRQLGIWFGFILAYQLARGLADRNPARAMWNGWRVLTFEQRTMHHLFELTAQRIVDSSHTLLTIVAWTYWNSEFTVVGLAILWVYLRRHEHFARFRNTVLLANVIGLFGYVLWPTAPPRMFNTPGFQDALDGMGSLNHGSALVSLASNPYAAMPSLHAADSLIVAVVLVAASRRWWAKALWALWPAWVWFCVMATANHFLLDVVAGIGVAIVSLLLVSQAHRGRALIANLL
jgi:membrane-associated phospholipid phosphatase